MIMDRVLDYFFLICASYCAISCGYLWWVGAPADLTVWLLAIACCLNVMVQSAASLWARS